jgi:hypothetical protein
LEAIGAIVSEYEIAKLVIQGLATIAVPVVVIWVGHMLTNAMKSREVSQKYVQLAIEILREKRSVESQTLRIWAVDVINRFSDIPLPDNAQSNLSETGLDDPSTTIRLDIRDEFGPSCVNGTAKIFQVVGDDRHAVASSVVFGSPTELEVYGRPAGQYFVTVQHPDFEDFESARWPLHRLDGMNIVVNRKNPI